VRRAVVPTTPRALLGELERYTARGLGQSSRPLRSGRLAQPEFRPSSCHVHELTPHEAWTFLRERPRTAKVATVRADGRPHIAPVWIDLDGDTIVFTTWYTTVKARNLRRDPRVSLCVDNDTRPFTFVTVEGLATLHDDPHELLRWATRIAGRYMGVDLADTIGRRNAVEGELLVRVTPRRITGQANVGD
jgi:PPOX class probable F420-dependent enzyme